MSATSEAPSTQRDTGTAPRVVVGPQESTFAVQAVLDGGGVVVAADDRPDALFWVTQGGYDGLPAALAASPGAGWVQLPAAGIEAVVATGAITTDRTWTCAKGVYSEPVAEHALALALAGLRDLPTRSRTTTWGTQSGASLYDREVVILGAGGITEALLALLAPFRATVTVVRRDAARRVEGAHRTVGLDRLTGVLGSALVVVLALALTPDTEHVIGAPELAAMREDAWLVNVARGAHVDTAALVAALGTGSIGGAALDVTDPEPLPDGHPLWRVPHCLITPHTANPWQAAQALLARRLTENVRRFAAGQPLLGRVDVAAGY